MTYWNIYDMHGTVLSAGILDIHSARRIAQAHANRMRQSVYLYEVAEWDEPGDLATEIAEIEPQ